MSQNTQALKAAGYLERREFTEEVKKHMRGLSWSMVQLLVARRLPKVALRFIDMGLMVLPEDRKWQGLYAPEAAVLMAAFIRWHSFDTRRSNYEVATFFSDLREGFGWYQELSPSARKQLAQFVIGRAQLRAV